MNKLVIIGNGFDLAHGLPTSYKDFIDDFFRSLPEEFETDLYKEIVEVNLDFKELEPFSNFEKFKESLKRISQTKSFELIEYNCNCTGTDGTGNKTFRFRFKNIFFLKICNTNTFSKWVDIENEYYKQLIDIKRRLSDNMFDGKKSLLTLNRNFDQVKKLLENYLHSKIESIYQFDTTESNPIVDIFKPYAIYNDPKRRSDYLNEFPNSDKDYLKREIKTLEIESKITDKIFLLDFNYTSTSDVYGTTIFKFYPESLLIKIHGEINNPINPINLGYGDEKDDEYKNIENLDDNEYLKNFKSFQYLQNDSYKKTLNCIDSEPFQVYIMGHSCGLSDRTLLNTIFEHKNCRSIKVFYYEYVEEGINKDNYTEIVQNISRHFDDKKAMREKIVNKTLCKPLPQNVRFNKKTH